MKLFEEKLESVNQKRFLKDVIWNGRGKDSRYVTCITYLSIYLQSGEDTTLLKESEND